MFELAEVIGDPDFIAPQPFLILRSTGRFVEGGFESITTPIQMFGPVQRATDKEVQMLPEADRVGNIMAFWATEPIYTTRGAAPLPSTHGEVPDVIHIFGPPSTIVYRLSAAPPSFILYLNGLAQRAGIDYTIDGRDITIRAITQDTVYVTWPVTDYSGQDAADILQYPANNGDQYRVLAVKHYPGSGYWKAMGTRMSAI